MYSHVPFFYLLLLSLYQLTTYARAANPQLFPPHRVTVSVSAKESAYTLANTTKQQQSCTHHIHKKKGGVEGRGAGWCSLIQNVRKRLFAVFPEA